MAKVIKANLARILESTDAAREENKTEQLTETPLSEPQEENAAPTGDQEFQAAYDELIAAAQDEVSLMLQDARSEAAQLLKDANKQAGEIRTGAYNEGYAEGLENARKQTMSIIKKAQKECDTLLINARSEREKMLGSVEGDVLRLALDAAGKILHIELDENKDAFLSLISGAMQSLKGVRSVTLRVNPEEYERCFGENKAVYQTDEGSVNADIFDDPGVPRYGAVIETENSVIDAGADAQLEQISRNMGVE